MGVDPDELLALRTTSAFSDHVAELVLGGDPRVRLVGDHAEAHLRIRERAASVRSSVWNMLAGGSTRGLREARRTEQLHPVPDSRDVFSRAALPRMPLASSLYPHGRVGPVGMPLLLTDADHVFLPGPPGSPHHWTVWESSDADLVRRAEHVFLRTWEVSRPVAEVDRRAPLVGRTLEVALLLADGPSDQEISADLGVGVRTVSAEVGTVVRWLDARSRTHAVALLAGGR
ncbi:helix-turn-helix transcriptional regulator [Phycicoccus sp. BSK3Z-2]|uniref:Helix-turn-helix transcriptional regulator n=1 Tax=Phycicoccus avicenniae TaxID=2828860 RepID=A0A941DD31_9MICO|nr:helix-turn-helix transcriptional regulator [Phycicoccus avicenniae]MBR7744117.1 helix-turn-helix transcriptional regulator [Phycicoccus avicenniae]